MSPFQYWRPPLDLGAPSPLQYCASSDWPAGLLSHTHRRETPSAPRPPWSPVSGFCWRQGSHGSLGGQGGALDLSIPACGCDVPSCQYRATLKWLRLQLSLLFLQGSAGRRTCSHRRYICRRPKGCRDAGVPDPSALTVSFGSVRDPPIFLLVRLQYPDSTPPPLSAAARIYIFKPATLLAPLLSPVPLSAPCSRPPSCIGALGDLIPPSKPCSSCRPSLTLFVHFPWPWLPPLCYHIPAAPLSLGSEVISVIPNCI